MQKCICLIVLGAILLLTKNTYAIKINVSNEDTYTDTETNFFDKEGNKVFLDQYEGQTILLVFWATWCESCVHELPELDNLEKDFRKLPFKVIALSQDHNGIDVIKKYFEANEIRHLEIFHDYQISLFRSMSVAGLPTAFLINSQGKIKKVFKGRVKWQNDDIRAIILSEIDGNPPMPKNSYSAKSLNMQMKKAPSKEINKTEEKNNEPKTKQPK
jgi:thiol-disulfide isomerase/thioredoxin